MSLHDARVDATSALQRARDEVGEVRAQLELLTTDLGAIDYEGTLEAEALLEALDEVGGAIDSALHQL